MQGRLAGAAAAQGLHDLPLAERLLAEARDHGRESTGAPLLLAWQARIEGQLDDLRDSAVGSLSPAELRVLRLLPTHLSFAKIATELYVSPNTVKTQAQSIYRKLGVGTRGEAVEAATESGLLDLPDRP
ncbi:MAG: response regulator transcription factor [Actinobacteria bacterium]|nr:response regulator transcription factor [Actinomycetota bacterium]